MKKYKQGDIIVVPFPFSDLSSQKLRPCLVISNSELAKSDEIIVLPITGTIYDDNFGYNIKNIHVDELLPKEPSQIRCHKIFTVNLRIIKGKVNCLKIQYLKQIIEKVITSDFLKIQFNFWTFCKDHLRHHIAVVFH